MSMSICNILRRVLAEAEQLLCSGTFTYITLNACEIPYGSCLLSTRKAVFSSTRPSRQVKNAVSGCRNACWTSPSVAK
eukprot:scaffold577_cov405-Prasinococcus_capsulatus_cf.AAC.2